MYTTLFDFLGIYILDLSRILQRVTVEQNQGLGCTVYYLIQNGRSVCKICTQSDLSFRVDSMLLSNFQH